MDLKSICCWILFGLLGAGSVWLLQHETALRLQVDVPRKPYSFALVQLWFWTMIVLGSYIAAFWVSSTGDVSFNTTCLALLGIGGATTTAARILDTSPEAAARPIDHRTMNSDGFIADILSDDKGISINRFQAVIFNLVLGLTFVLRVIAALRADQPFVFPALSSEQLGLLGISSATYLALKMKESPAAPGSASSAPVITAAAAPAVALGAFIASDELPDIEAADDRDD